MFHELIFEMTLLEMLHTEMMCQYSQDIGQQFKRQGDTLNYLPLLFFVQFFVHPVSGSVQVYNLVLENFICLEKYLKTGHIP